MTADPDEDRRSTPRREAAVDRLADLVAGLDRAGLVQAADRLGFRTTDSQAAGGGQGCPDCFGWLQQWITNAPMEQLGDCADSFRRKCSYFSAELLGCPSCRTTWLHGYYECFRDLVDEWGDRHWVCRPLSDDQIAQIEAARGTRCLDLDTFAAPTPGRVGTPALDVVEPD